MRKVSLVGVLAASLASAAPVAPQLTLGTPQLTGTIDGKSVMTTLKRAKPTLFACYRKALVKTPELQGTATATFTIGADGKVTEAAAPGLGDDVDHCLSAALAKLRFKRPKQPVEVTIDITTESAVAKASATGAFASLTAKNGVDDTNLSGGLLGNEAGEMTGGFGYGRDGWGTSGTAVASGGGGMRGRATAVPHVSIGQPTVTGNLDKGIVRRFVNRNLQKLSYCYEKQLLQTPDLAGKVTADFTIGSDGNVTASTAIGVDADVDTCIADAIQNIWFPNPKGGGEVKVSFPMTFHK